MHISYSNSNYIHTRNLGMSAKAYHNLSLTGRAYSFCFSSLKALLPLLKSFPFETNFHFAEIIENNLLPYTQRRRNGVCCINICFRILRTDLIPSPTFIPIRKILVDNI